MINRFALVFLLFLAVKGDSGCQTPQTAYQFANGSIFVGLEDIQRSLDMVFNDPLDEIQSGGGFRKNTYTIKSIKVKYVYKPETQVETISNNSITQKGGMVQLQAYFTYHWIEYGTLSVKQGTCEGYGRFNTDFQIVNTKIPTFTSSTGQLVFSSTVQDLKLTSMVFQKLSGEEPTASAQNMIDSLMNSEPTTELSPLKWQIQERVQTMNQHLGDFINQIPAAQFSADHPYSFEGRRVDYDYTLTNYELQSTAESMSLKVWPLNSTDVKCYNLATYGGEGTYYAISQSVIENSWNQLQSLRDDQRKSIVNLIVDNSWELPNFFFKVQDLSWFIPDLTDNYAYSDPISVLCSLNQGDAPVYIKATETFDTVMTYDCNVNGQTGANIMEFTVDAAYQFTIAIDSEYLVQFQVGYAQFDVTSFQVAAPYTFTRESLLEYYVGLAANKMNGSNVFGTAMLSLPAYFKQPSWKISDDLTTIFFYDAASSVQTQ